MIDDMSMHRPYAQRVATVGKFGITDKGYVTKAYVKPIGEVVLNEMHEIHIDKAHNNAATIRNVMRCFGLTEAIVKER